METTDRNLWQSLGFLRLALIALAIANMLLTLVNLGLATAPASHGLWSLLATVIAPVMAPLLAVVLLFEYIMSRVRAADADGEMRARYTTIGRIELGVMLITLAFWVPFFIQVMT